MATEFVIYTDESVKDGAYFSNFYGGALVRSRDLENVNKRLALIKAEHNLHGELKWIKVTGNYLDKYNAVMDRFFDLVADDLVKVRIMFTNNTYVPQGLSPETAPVGIPSTLLSVYQTRLGARVFQFRTRWAKTGSAKHGSDANQP